MAEKHVGDAHKRLQVVQTVDTKHAWYEAEAAIILAENDLLDHNMRFRGSHHLKPKAAKLSPAAPQAARQPVAPEAARQTAAARKPLPPVILKAKPKKAMQPEVAMQLPEVAMQPAAPREAEPEPEPQAARQPVAPEAARQPGAARKPLLPVILKTKPKKAVRV